MNNIDIKKIETMTKEEMLADPSLEPLHALIQNIDKPGFIFAPKKFASVMISHVKIETRKLFLENPALSIKDVLITVYKPLTNDIPPDLMLKLTENIIKIWTELSTEATQKKMTAIAA